MAQSKENFMTYGLSGTIGKIITFSLRAGKTIVGKVRTKNSKPPSSEQLVVRNTFGAAVVYAKAVNADPVTRALYNAKASAGVSAYNIALADAFTPPKVLSINKDNYHGLADDSITVRATDDFKVAKVKIAIHTALGVLVEEGNAVLQINGLDWLYTVTGENEVATGSKIKATAIDLPENEDVMEVTV